MDRLKFDYNFVSLNNFFPIKSPTSKLAILTLSMITQLQKYQTENLKKYTNLFLGLFLKDALCFFICGLYYGKPGCQKLCWPEPFFLSSLKWPLTASYSLQCRRTGNGIAEYFRQKKLTKKFQKYKKMFFFHSWILMDWTNNNFRI